MLEGWTTLGFMAAHSQRARLGLMVGGVHYRNPGLWVKAATTLDVLSGGRAWLGIGAAWNQAESEGLGFPWPTRAERFEMLEDTLRIAHGMWQGERGSEEEFDGRQFHATRLLNVPQSISRPRVPILIGGGGEKKTLRLVAQYADASNLFGGPDELVPKYAILAEHCAAVGRDFAEIERTNMQGVGLGSAGAWSRAPESPDAIVERFGRLAEAGVQHVIVNFAEANDPALIELLGSRVLPQLRDVEAADPRGSRQSHEGVGRMSWQALADAAPELATFGAERLHDQVAYLATLKPDGSPRLHPVRPVVTAGACSCSWRPPHPRSAISSAIRGTRSTARPRATSRGTCESSESRAPPGGSTTDGRSTANAGSAFLRGEQFLLYELGIGAAFRQQYGGDGRPQRQRWRAS